MDLHWIILCKSKYRTKMNVNTYYPMNVGYRSGTSYLKRHCVFNLHFKKCARLTERWDQLNRFRQQVTDSIAQIHNDTRFCVRPENSTKFIFGNFYCRFFPLVLCWPTHANRKPNKTKQKKKTQKFGLNFLSRKVKNETYATHAHAHAHAT